MDAKIEDLNKRFQKAFQKIESAIEASRDSNLSKGDIEQLRVEREEDLARIKALRGEIANLLEGAVHEGS